MLGSWEVWSVGRPHHECQATHHPDSLHLIVAQREQPLARDRHLRLLILALWLELAPERATATGETGARRPV